MKKNFCKSCLTHEFLAIDVESIGYSDGSVDSILSDVSVAGNLAIEDGLLKVSDGNNFSTITPQNNASIEIFQNPDCDDGSYVALICARNPNIHMTIGNEIIVPCGNREIVAYDNKTGFDLIKSPSYGFPDCGTCLINIC